MAPVRYAIGLVTYIDILGFKELIDTRTAGDISRIIRVVKEAVRPRRFKSRIKEIPDDEFVSFSDLSVIATPLEKARHSAPALQLYSLLMHLIHAQSTLIFDYGIIIRGAVTIGEVVRSWRQLYGPAIVRAYELERHCAVHPRIIIDRAVFDVLEGLPGAWHNDEDYDKRALAEITREDEDGILFVDYLRAIQGEFDDPSFYSTFLAKHRSLIRKRLKKYTDKSRIRAKYEWLKRYHGETVARIKKSS